MVAFTGRCLVHRAEIMQLHGAWQDALDEARAGGARAPMSRRPPRRRSTGRASCIGCAGELAAAEEAYREASRRGHRAAARPRAAAARAGQQRARRSPRSGASLAETTEPLQRVRAAAGVRRDHARRRRADEARARVRRARASSRARFASGCSPRVVAHARGAVDLAAATRVRPSSRCGAPAASLAGARARRTRRRACGCSSGSHAARSATPTRPRSSSRRRATLRRAAGGARRSRASTRSSARRDGQRTGSRHASSRCCAWSRPARRTRRSPPSWCSASGRSIATSATSSPSCGVVVAQRAATAYAYRARARLSETTHPRAGAGWVVPRKRCRRAADRVGRMLRSHVDTPGRALLAGRPRRPAPGSAGVHYDYRAGRRRRAAARAAPRAGRQRDALDRGVLAASWAATA